MRNRNVNGYIINTHDNNDNDHKHTYNSNDRELQIINHNETLDIISQQPHEKGA